MFIVGMERESELERLYFIGLSPLGQNIEFCRQIIIDRGYWKGEPTCKNNFNLIFLLKGQRTVTKILLLKSFFFPRLYCEQLMTKIDDMTKNWWYIQWTNSNKIHWYTRAREHSDGKCRRHYYALVSYGHTASISQKDRFNVCFNE